MNRDPVARFLAFARGGLAPTFEPLLDLVVAAEFEHGPHEVAAESHEVAEVACGLRTLARLSRRTRDRT